MRPTGPTLLALLGLLLAGCGAEPASTVTSGELRAVRAPGGEELRVPARAERVFADSATGFDLMLALLPRERFAGVVSTALRYSAVARTAQELGDLPRPEGFHAEDVLALGPDLVLVSDWRPPAVPDLLRARGISTVRLPTPATWEDLEQLVTFAAALFAEEAAGDELLQELRARRATLAAPSDRSDLRVLAYSNFGTSGYCAGSRTSWDLMIELAGMRNAAAEAGIEGNSAIDLERVLQLDPDVLLVSESEEGGDSPTLAVLRTHEAARELRAVKEQRWVVLPVHLHATSSHHLLDAAEALARGVDALDD